MKALKNNVRRIVQWGYKGLEVTELLLVLGILGALIAVVLYALGGAFTSFANHIIATLFSW